MYLKTIVLALLVTFLTCIGFYTFYVLVPASIWEGLVISKSALTTEYCEFNNPENVFHQKMNTFSNLIYLFFGVIILSISVIDSKNTKPENILVQFPKLSFLMGFVFVYLCFGSAFFHASLRVIGQRIDMHGTYGVILVLVSLGFYHILFKYFKVSKTIFLVCLLGILMSMIFIAQFISSGVLVPVLILFQLLAITINYFIYPKKHFLLLAILSLVFIVYAVKIRTNDVNKIDCDPHSFIQGHALWHVLTAMSSFFSYAFYRFTR